MLLWQYWFIGFRLGNKIELGQQKRFGQTEGIGNQIDSERKSLPLLNQPICRPKAKHTYVHIRPFVRRLRDGEARIGVLERLYVQYKRRSHCTVLLNHSVAVGPGVQTHPSMPPLQIVVDWKQLDGCMLFTFAITVVLREQL